jgi:hypothetical protein
MLGFLSVHEWARYGGSDIDMNIVKKDDFLIKLTRIYMRAQLSQHYILTITLIDRPTRLIRSHCLLAH